MTQDEAQEYAEALIRYQESLERHQETLLTAGPDVTWEQIKKLPLCRLEVRGSLVEMKNPRSTKLMRWREQTPDIQAWMLTKLAQQVGLSSTMAVTMTSEQWEAHTRFLAEHTHHIEGVDRADHLRWWEHQEQQHTLVAGLDLMNAYTIHHHPELLDVAVGPLPFDLDEDEGFDMGEEE